MRHKLLMMLDEFPALGRLDFFETSLAFMAGYGIRAFLIAQSLNQIEKAYGDHNSILDNCHVRIAFATNDDRTAKRLSDTLGTTTEQRAMRNYAGHRLAPWLAHVMVSRQETARQLLTPGEVMQLPADEELVLVSGLPPVRAEKLRYFLDPNFIERVLPAPRPQPGPYADRSAARPDDWAGLVRGADARLYSETGEEDDEDGGMQQQPQADLPEQAVPEQPDVEPVEVVSQAEDDNVPADKRAMEQAQQLNPVSRGYALDESSPDAQVLGL